MRAGIALIITTVSRQTCSFNYHLCCRCARGATTTVDLQKDAKTLGLKSPVATPAAVRAAYLRKAKASHPDAGGSTKAFQDVQSAFERLGTQRTAQAAIDERFYVRRSSDFIDRINHRLSRPLGNLVPTRYKIAFRLGALVLILGGAVMDRASDKPRRDR